MVIYERLMVLSGNKDPNNHTLKSAKGTDSKFKTKHRKSEPIKKLTKEISKLGPITK